MYYCIWSILTNIVEVTHAFLKGKKLKSLSREMETYFHIQIRENIAKFIDFFLAVFFMMLQC